MPIKTKTTVAKVDSTKQVCTLSMHLFSENSLAFHAVELIIVYHAREKIISLNYSPIIVPIL